MRICHLTIQNFRGIQSADLTFPKHGVLFGANNVGKSTIVEALALLFGRERMTHALCDWDFYGGVLRPDSRFTIIGTITDFGAGSTDEINAFPQWFLGERAARPVWWHEETKTVRFDVEPQPGAKLAAQIALCVRYNDETCEFEPIRFFYDGPCDPFTDDHRVVPPVLLHELGVFLLPSNRQWDKLLAFGSSSFLKALRQSDALPGSVLSDLKAELRSPKAKIEEADNLKTLLQTSEEELRAFLMLDGAAHLVYRPTSLDTLSVLQSLVPHVQLGGGDVEGLLLPFARHGAGMMLAISEKRRNLNNCRCVRQYHLHIIHPSSVTSRSHQHLRELA